MIKSYLNFINEAYTLDDIDKKYYVMEKQDPHEYIVIEIVKKDPNLYLEMKSRTKFAIQLKMIAGNEGHPVVRHPFYDDFLDLFGNIVPRGQGDRLAVPRNWPVPISLYNWKRHRKEIVFETNDKEEAMSFYQDAQNGLFGTPEERIRIKEELRLKYIDIDPYGEENWV